MSIIQANSSVTHTYGNVSCVAMDYILKFFEEDFFKVKHISTKLAYRQLDIFRSKNEFWKLHKPFLLVRPRIDVNDDSKYFYGSTMTNRVHNVRSPMEYGNVIDLLEDDYNGVKLGFLWNRTKIYYDVVIIVDSYNEQLNLASYLTNAIIPNAPFPIKTPLESHIPKNIVQSIANKVGISKDDIPSILRYMNTHSNIPITYKFKNGSGNDEFFGLYSTNIEAIISDISLDDGQEKGLLVETFTISFTLSLEFYNMAMYYLSLRDGNNRFIACPPINESNATIVPLFTIPLLENIELPMGWKIHSAPALYISSNTVDETELSVLDEPTKLILRYQQNMGLPQDLFIQFRLFRHRDEIPPDSGQYKIDLSDLNHPKLIIYNGDLKSTYRLFIIIHNAYIHSITSELNEFNKEK